MPVFRFKGRDDQVVPPHMSIDLADRIGGAQTAELSSGGHFAPLVAADAYADIVLGFVAAA